MLADITASLVIVVVVMSCVAVLVPHQRDPDQDAPDQERHHLPEPKAARGRLALVYRQCFWDKLREGDKDERTATDEQDEGGLSRCHLAFQSEDEQDPQDR